MPQTTPIVRMVKIKKIQTISQSRFKSGFIFSTPKDKAVSQRINCAYLRPLNEQPKGAKMPSKPEFNSAASMDRKSLCKAIFKACYRQGNFKLRSGLTSTEYFDKYRFECQPQILKAVAEHLIKFIPADTQALAGLEMGGIPIATALSLATGLPTVFVRKKAKDYGTEQFAEGFDIVDKKILIIEDVVTTGGQVLLSSNDLRKAGAQISDVLCVIQRSQDLSPFTENHLKLQSLFTMEELKQSVDT